MSDSVPAGARASLEGARVALRRMMYANNSATSRTAPATMAVRAKEGWDAVEQVLRVVTAHDELSGQPLLAEARKQNALTLDEAHALVALNDWVERTRAPGSAAQMLTLPPTEAEREVATNALTVLERIVGTADGSVRAEMATETTIIAANDATSVAVSVPITPASGTPAQNASITGALAASAVPQSEWASPRPTNPAQPARAVDASANVVINMPPKFEPLTRPVLQTTGAHLSSSGLILGLLLLVVLAVGGTAWYVTKSRGSDSAGGTDAGVAAYTKGSIETAQMEFRKAVDSNPKDVRALTYLGRIAREQHDNANAQKYLQQAIQAEPENALALRELGSTLLTEGEPELARRFYVRSLTVNGTDHVAQGFLGCALLQLHRDEEAKKWFDRAGAGDWTGCSAIPAKP
ncbi:MAG: tetratricopeptide repeat protein [Gemmatimonadaceae bacterium]